MRPDNDSIIGFLYPEKESRGLDKWIEGDVKLATTFRPF